MLEGSENKRRTNCWLERTELEKGLMALLTVSTLVISALAVMLFLQTTVSITDGCENSSSLSSGEDPLSSENISDTTLEPCKSLACLKSATEILSRINTRIEPCEDFYTFSCNNKPPSLNPSDFSHSFVDLELLRIREIYTEPITDDDHPIVKVQKVMYDACMNASAVAEDAAPTLKEVLKMVGGWPVLEPQWNQAKFDWVQTTYKLRQLGYKHNSFLDLNIVPDPDNTEKYIFQISIPTVDHIYSKWFDSDENSGFMTDVALALGAEVHRAMKEMSDTYEFLNYLQWHRNSVMGEEVVYHRATIAELRQKEDAVNWIEFISTIAGPDVSVSLNDVVLFPPERALDNWIGVLERTKKQTLANYLLWKVVEEVIPYLTDVLLKGRVRPRLMVDEECETRSEFCIHEISRRFSPSPIDIMYLRKYLPKEKREAVQELADNIKWALLEVLQDGEWMNVLDKKQAITEIEEFPIIVGAPGNYFDDSILDSKFDIEVDTNNFLKLLSEANRNNHDRLYSLIQKSPDDTKIAWAPLTTMQSFTVEGPQSEITILASMVQDPIFNEEQLNYLNYANMGVLLKFDIFELFMKANRSREAVEGIADCLVYSKLPENISISEVSDVQVLIAHELALKVSYKAYQKWAKSNAESEPSLVALDYTPEQLFWIAPGYLFCQYTDADILSLNPEWKTIYSSIMQNLINSNPDLIRDFECSETPSEICELV